MSKRDFLTAAAGMGAGAVMPVFAQVTHNAEKDLEARKVAKHIMVFGSPYASDEWQTSPHMHSSIKKNIQEMSGGQIYVDIRDKGGVGIGTKLMANVSRGAVSAGLVSVSNLTPIAPELDILNIPFWSASNQNYLNLVTSKAWESLILDKVRGQGYVDVLFNYVPGPRTATTTKLFNKVIRTPADAKGLVFRIPPSKSLKIYYELAGTHPRTVDWGKVANVVRHGRIDAMDSGIIGLYNGPDGLRNDLGVISQIDSVHDGWLAVINQKWLKSLPSELRIVVREAAEKTFKEHLQQVVQVTDYCSKGFEKLGVRIYTPSEDEKKQWAEQCGHARPEWGAFKKQLLGDAKVFDSLVEAAQVSNGYVYGG